MGDMRSAVGVSGSDSDVSPGEGGKMYEIYDENRNGKGVAHGSRNGDEQIAKLEHSYLRAWVLQSFYRIEMG